MLVPHSWCRKKTHPQTRQLIPPLINHKVDPDIESADNIYIYIYYIYIYYILVGGFNRLEKY